MLTAPYQNADERPRFNIFEELRTGNLRAIQWKFLRHLLARRELQALQVILPTHDIGRDLVAEYLTELATSKELANALASAGARKWGASIGGDAPLPLERLLSGGGRGRAIFGYVWTRIVKPEIVVETGCFTGSDSAVVLEALRKNEHGHLYTIDLPAEEGSFSQSGVDSGLPPGLNPGFLVPDTLRPRWSLILGDARRELLPLLEKVRSVDLFFHDSHHSYSHMMWEYASAWPFLNENGLLVSDDISWNTALWDFAKGVGVSPVILRREPNVGALVRRSK